MKSRFLSLFLIGAIVSNISLFSNDINVYADNNNEENQNINGLTSDEINKLLDEEKLKLDESQKKIEESKKQREEIEKESLEIDENIKGTQEKIIKIEEEVVLLEKDNIELDKEINNAEKKIEENFEIIKDLMKISYEQKLGGYLGLLLESKDFGNFIRRLEVVSSLIKNNDRIIVETTELQKKLEDKKNLILNKKKELEDKKEVVIKEKNNLEELLIEKEKKVKELVDIQIELEKEALLSEYQIKALEEQGKILDEEILKALKDSMGDYLGGTMAWPVPGYTRISSPYGNRVHPITGVHKLHTGIDIPAPAGTPVKVANSGVVIMSKMDKAYGNVVAVDHGGGIATLYAHNSKLLVNVGDKVIKGQTIAEVGTTGYSTGNHCHFEVKIDGKTVDPIPFLEEKQ